MNTNPFNQFLDYINKEGRRDKVSFVFAELEDGTQLSFPFGDPTITYFQLGMAMRSIEQKVRLAELDVTGSA